MADVEWDPEKAAATVTKHGVDFADAATVLHDEAATVISVVVTGSPVGVGLTAQFTATANMSDGTTANVTTAAARQSSNTNVATVSALGVVTGVADGQTTITATYQGLTATDMPKSPGRFASGDPVRVDCDRPRRDVPRGPSRLRLTVSN